jgi:hypothetical protein
MPTRPQQRPRLIQRITPLPFPTNRNSHTLARSCNTPLPTPFPLHRRRRTTHTRRRRHAHRRRPPTHPPTNPAKVQALPLEFAVRIDRNNHVIRIRARPSTRLGIAKEPELQTHGRVHDQDARGAEKERRCAQDPGFPHGARRLNPASSLTRREVVPCAGVREQGCGVKQVSEERGREEGGRESRCRFADLVHVELG